MSTAPTPVNTPHAINAAEVKGTSGSIGTAWTAETIVYSANTDAAAKLDAASPRKRNGVETFPRLCAHIVGWPVLHARQIPQFASVAITTWSPGFTVRTSLPTESTNPAPS